MTTSSSTISTLTLVLVSLLAGCGKEAGRVPFAAEATNAATMALQAGEVSFWTELDIDYEGDAALAYRIDLLQGGSRVATAECQALGAMSIKMGWVETQLGSSRSRRGRGKMTCSAPLAKSGPTVVEATLAFDPRPVRVTLRKADLVVKQ
jgi:hypothetical protein